MKKAQVANEFIILLGSGILIVMVFLMFTAQDMEYLVTKKEMNVLRDIGFSVQSELFAAASVKDGYMREFEMPKQFRGVTYNASINNNYLVLWSQRTGQHQEYIIPDITGTIQHGINTIRKSGGVLYLN